MPDHGFWGSRFWEQLYSEVGITSFKLCHTFRQWIVPGVAEVQLQSSCDILEGCEHREHALPGSSSRQSLLHVVHASLRIHQETDYMIGDNEQPQIGRETGPTQQTCNYTDKIVQKKADALFEVRLEGFYGFTLFALFLFYIL